MSLVSTVIGKVLTVAVEAAEAVAAQVSRTRNVGGLLELVEVKGGAFAMGSGKSSRWVGLTDYFMGKTAVTEGQWRKLIEEGEEIERARFAAMRQFGLDPAKINPSHPAVCTSWHDAREYLRRLAATTEATEAKGTGLRFSLPTEAQQEFSIRGRAVDLGQVMGREGVASSEAAVHAFVDSRFENFVIAPPDSLPEVGGAILTIDEALPEILSGRNRVLASRVFGTRSGRLTAEEAWFNQPGLAAADWGPVNPQGLHGRPGGVWEWGEDWHSDTLGRARFSVDPLGPETGQYRVLRGGSWACNNGPGGLRAASRGIGRPGGRYDGFGFRVAAALQDLGGVT